MLLHYVISNSILEMGFFNKHIMKSFPTLIVRFSDFTCLLRVITVQGMGFHVFEGLDRFALDTGFRDEFLCLTSSLGLLQVFSISDIALVFCNIDVLLAVMHLYERYIYLANFLNAKQKTSDYSVSMPAQSFPVSRTHHSIHGK